MSDTITITIGGERTTGTLAEIAKLLAGLAGLVDEAKESTLARSVKLGACLLQVVEALKGRRNVWAEFEARCGIHRAKIRRCVRLAAALANARGELDAEKVAAVVQAWNMAHPDEDPLIASVLTLRRAEVITGNRTGDYQTKPSGNATRGLQMTGSGAADSRTESFGNATRGLQIDLDEPLGGFPPEDDGGEGSGEPNEEDIVEAWDDEDVPLLDVAGAVGGGVPAGGVADVDAEVRAGAGDGAGWMAREQLTLDGVYAWAERIHANERRAIELGRVDAGAAAALAEAMAEYEAALNAIGVAKGDEIGGGA